MSAGNDAGRVRSPVGAARLDAAAYASAIERLAADPSGYWAEIGNRLDWIQPFTQVKDTSFDKADFRIRWYADGVLNVSANCLDRQVRTIEAGVGVGYGRTFVAREPTRIATIAAGYADGWPRGPSGRGRAFFGDAPLPILGRISMDTFMVDISALPNGTLYAGDEVELIGPHQSIEDVARDAGAIPYEILTGLGHRFARTHVGGDGSVIGPKA